MIQFTSSIQLYSSYFQFKSSFESVVNPSCGIPFVWQSHAGCAYLMISVYCLVLSLCGCSAPYVTALLAVVVCVFHVPPILVWFTFPVRLFQCIAIPFRPWLFGLRFCSCLICVYYLAIRCLSSSHLLDSIHLAIPSSWPLLDFRLFSWGRIAITWYSQSVGWCSVATREVPCTVSITMS